MAARGDGGGRAAAGGRAAERQAGRALGSDAGQLARDVRETQEATPRSPSRGAPARGAAAVPLPPTQVAAVVEKETGFRTWGSWQLVTWCRRYLYTTPEALCYQHLDRHQVPHGLTKSIAFSTVERVGVHADEPTVLLLECVTRQYFFRFPSVVLCEAWAGLITVAASAAR